MLTVRLWPLVLVGMMAPRVIIMISEVVCGFINIMEQILGLSEAEISMGKRQVIRVDIRSL